MINVDVMQLEHDGPTEITSSARDERDRTLFARFVTGDQDAFKELYALYERPLYLYCRHMLSTPLEVEDVFQEVWLRIIRIRTRGEVVEHFRAMIFTVARNAAINNVRTRRNRPSIPFSQQDIELHPAVSVEAKGYSDVEDLVNRALKRLPEPQREAFVLHAMMGYTFQEIAEMQGVTMTGAKTRAFRARTYLRTLLANWLGLAEEETDEHLDPQSPRNRRSEKE